MNNNVRERKDPWWIGALVVAIPLIALFGVGMAVYKRDSSWLGLCLVLVALL